MLEYVILEMVKIFTESKLENTSQTELEHCAISILVSIPHDFNHLLPFIYMIFCTEIHNTAFISYIYFKIEKLFLSL